MTPLETDLTLSEPGRLSPEFLAAIARSKGRVPAKNITEINPEEILQISAQITVSEPPPVQAVRSAEGYEVGELIGNKGVYLGIWQPQNKKGVLLRQFNLFAAPYDMGKSWEGKGQKMATNFKTAVSWIGNIHNYMGRSGRGFVDDAALYEALDKGGRYGGEWFMPPYELLAGKNDREDYIGCVNISDFGEHSDLKKTFTVDADPAEAYWSCTRIERGMLDYRKAVVFSRTAVPAAKWVIEDKCLTRLMRVELIQ